MTTEQHPITPPPELVEKWRKSGPADAAVNNAYEKHLATQAARWGADQELEACEEWLRTNIGTSFSSSVESELRAARRPKPPSLAEQAMAELDQIPTHDNEGRTVGGDVSIIRRALERLQELEEGND